MKKVYVPLAKGFEEIEAITVIDVLRRAGFEVITFSIDEDIFIKGSHDIVLKADSFINEIDADKADAIILPGGMPGSANLDNSMELKKLLRVIHSNGKLVGAICAAPFVLGKMGLLKGIRATCYPGFEKFLDGALISNDKVVFDRNIITGKGVGAALEFSLKIVEIMIGKDQAISLGSKMVVN